MAGNEEIKSVREKVGDVKIQVARVEERLVSMGKTQDTMAEDIGKILIKMGDQNNSIQKYRNDRSWVIGIFGVLYAGLIAWIHSRGSRL